jgi:hypothetical protein
MRTHKFLAKGAVGSLSGFAWPVPGHGTPGAWVEAAGPLAVCARGVHVCRPFELAHWLHDELWEVEAEGDPIDGLDCIVVPRARLVRRVDAWSGAGGRSFAGACVERAASQAGADPVGETRALLDDARFMADGGYVALAAFIAAVAVSRSADDAVTGTVYRRERAWQSAWITDQMLSTPGE